MLERPAVMARKNWKNNDGLLRVFAYGSVVSTYILIVIGGYVTTSNSGLGCGESWPLCEGAVFPSLNRPELVIELSLGLGTGKQATLFFSQQRALSRSLRK